MLRLRLIPLLAAVAWLGGATLAGAQDQQPLFPKAKSLLSERGMSMNNQEALDRITFRPFIPIVSPKEVALLPSFHGTDKDNPENRGIGYEYVRAGRTFVLRQWPRAGGSLARYAPLPGQPGCADAHVAFGGDARRPKAIAWETASRVFLLQLDGSDDPASLKKEWSRLIARGACK
jgi:hypothetical protein